MFIFFVISLSLPPPFQILFHSYTDNQIFISRKVELWERYRSETKNGKPRRKTLEQLVREVNLVNPITGKLITKSAASKICCLASIDLSRCVGHPLIFSQAELLSLHGSIFTALTQGIPVTYTELRQAAQWYIKTKWNDAGHPIPARFDPLKRNDYLPSIQWATDVCIQMNCSTRKGTCTVIGRCKVLASAGEAFIKRLDDAILKVIEATAAAFNNADFPADHIINLDESFCNVDHNGMGSTKATYLLSHSCN